MPGPNTDSSEVIATYVYDMVSAAKSDLGLQDVWYGDQELLPHTPAACVIPGNKRREFAGASYRTMNTFETYVLIYYGKIQDIQANLHASTAIADSVETLVHSDLTLGGNVISVICTQDEPGMVTKSGVLMVGARLTFESQSKTTFPQQVVS